MHTEIMIALLELILAVLNYSIYEKEQIKEHYKTLLLKLVSIDPRSLIKGKTICAYTTP